MDMDADMGMGMDMNMKMFIDMNTDTHSDRDMDVITPLSHDQANYEIGFWSLFRHPSSPGSIP